MTRERAWPLHGRGRGHACERGGGAGAGTPEGRDERLASFKLANPRARSSRSLRLPPLAESAELLLVGYGFFRPGGGLRAVAGKRRPALKGR